MILGGCVESNLVASMTLIAFSFSSLFSCLISMTLGRATHLICPTLKDTPGPSGWKLQRGRDAGIHIKNLLYSKFVCNVEERSNKSPSCSQGPHNSVKRQIHQEINAIKDYSH